MISEMERLILKADLTSINKKENSTLSEMPQKKSNTMLPLASKNGECDRGLTFHQKGGR